MIEIFYGLILMIDLIFIKTLNPETVIIFLLVMIIIYKYLFSYNN